MRRYPCLWFIGGLEGRAAASDSSVTKTIPSDYAQAREVQRIIRDEVARAGFDTDSQFAIKLALEEALVNAVKHGNKMAKEKVVKVQYHITPQRADIAIEDQGCGFNPAEVRDATADENLEMCSGRGILLMRAYMSSVVFNPQGNKVTLSKFSQGYAPRKTAE